MSSNWHCGGQGVHLCSQLLPIPWDGQTTAGAETLWAAARDVFNCQSQVRLSPCLFSAPLPFYLCTAAPHVPSSPLLSHFSPSHPLMPPSSCPWGKGAPELLQPHSSGAGLSWGQLQQWCWVGLSAS